MSEEKKHVNFDVIIGNPPYQEEMANTSDKPIYPEFMSGSYQVAGKAMLITLGRFLFNAGKTPKRWNEKMLSNTHLKIMQYFSKSTNVFQNNDIKGGIAVTYFDKNKKQDPIGFFTPFEELNSIVKKVIHSKNFKSLSNIVYSSVAYQFTDELHHEYPNAKLHMSKGNMYSVTTNIFDKLPQIFLDTMPNDKDYIGLYGRSNGKRVIKYLPKRYIRSFKNLNHYKVFIPKSNGSGALGEVLSTPLIGTPLIGHTQTFMSIGDFKNKDEAEALFKYIKSKFARAMLGALKITQDNPARVWKCVPLQDFTSSSDIDWSKSIPEIDQQLYKKYGLNQKEIDFIETHVKTMD